MSGQTQKRRDVVKRPTRIKVLTINYTVHWLNEEEWYLHQYDPKAVGITERDRGIIAMRASGVDSEDAFRATLLHEVLHTCTQSMRIEDNLKNVEDGEEFFISQVAPVLMCVLNDNPNLVAYLLNVGK